MKIPNAYILAVYIFLEVAYADHAVNPHFDVSKAIEEFANRVAGVHGTKVSWICTDGTHHHLKTRKIYHRYFMDVSIGSLRFGRGEEILEPVHKTDTATATNNADHSHKTSMSLSIITEESETLSNSKTFMFNHSHTISFGVPLVFSATGRFEVDNKVESKTTTTTRTTKQIDITVDLEVPAKTKVTLTVFHFKRIREIPWTADVTFKGWFAVWYDSRVNGHYLWFYPVGTVAAYHRELHFVAMDEVVFIAEGVFKSISVVDTEAVVEGTKLDRLQRRNNFHRIK